MRRVVLSIGILALAGCEEPGSDEGGETSETGDGDGDPGDGDGDGDSEEQGGNEEIGETGDETETGSDAGIEDADDGCSCSTDAESKPGIKAVVTAAAVIGLGRLLENGSDSAE